MINFTHCCIITDQVFELTNFYQKIFGVEAEKYGDSYSELEVGDTILAIFDIDEHEKMAPGSANIMSNNNIILEFKVDDIKKEYRKVKNLGVEIVKEITTQSWGNTSFYFRDPDDNLVNFYNNE